MTAKELLDVIRAAVRDTAGKGAGVVSVVDLDRYLAGLEGATAASPQPPTPEMIQAQIALHRSFVDEGLEMFRSVIRAGQEARQSSLWINGGAAVALLAFIGHIVAADGKSISIVAALAWPLGLYVTGVLLSAMANGSTYAAQANWTDAQRGVGTAEGAKHHRAGVAWNRISIGLVLSAYVLFGIGSWLAYGIFHGLGAAPPTAN